MGDTTLKEVIDQALESQAIKMNVALPAEVVSFDPDTQLAVVQIMIDKIQDDGEPVTIPQLQDVPVVQPMSGKISITMPIEPKDTGLLVFNQRNIDTFIVEGVRAVPHDRRLSDIQDAVLIMGLYSQKSVVPEYDIDGMAIRSVDNTTCIQLKQDGTINLNTGSTTVKIEKDGAVTINTPSIELTGDINMTGNLDVDGTINSSGDITTDSSVTATTEVTAGVIGLTTHKHTISSGSSAGVTTPSIP